MAFNLNNIPSAASKKDAGINIEKLLKTEIKLFENGFSNKKKQVFYMELAVLLRAGVSIKKALTIIKGSYRKTNDKEMLESVMYQVINGKPFSDSLFMTKQVTEYEFYSLKIGEETGTIARVCQELGIFYERKNEQQRIVIAALTYPAIVLSTAILVVIFMLSYVVPMFQDIFKQNNMELPLITRLIIKTSAFVKSYGAIILLSVLGLIICGRVFKNNIRYRSFSHYLLLKIPILGPFVLKVYLAQFTQAVTLLTTSKVPILNSMQMVRKMIQFVPLQETLHQVEKSILKGDSLSESMHGNQLFDSRIIALIKVAEETNQTEYVFTQLSQQYNQEVVQQSKIMSTVLEPFIILFVGILVAILLVAMYLPMFQLSSAIG